MIIPHLDPRVVRLSSGLTLLLEEDTTHPIIATQLWVETGSIHEEEWLGSGISHCVEHMVFKGSRQWDGATIAKRVQAAGGQWNAYTSFDSTVYYIDGPAAGRDVFLETLIDMVFYPRFPEDEFEREKEVIFREIDMTADDPDDVHAELIYRTAFLRDNRRYPIIGMREDFARIKRKDAIAYHQRRYLPKNAFLVISGDFESEKLINQLEEMTRDLPSKAPRPVLLPEEPAIFFSRSRRGLFDVSGKKMFLGWQIIPESPEDVLALDLLDIILGKGRSSLLYQKLHEEEKLCFSVGTSSSFSRGERGFFGIVASVEDAKESAMVEGIYRVIEEGLNQLSQKDIDKALRMEKSSYIASLATASSRASWIGNNWRDTREPDGIFYDLQAQESCTPEDLRRVGHHYLKRGKSLYAVIENQKPSAEKKRLVQRKEKRLESFRLTNGLPVYFFEDKRLDQMAITASIATGKLSETPETAGINAFIANLFTKGSEAYSQKEIAWHLDAMGARFASYSGHNTTQASLLCLTEDMAKSLPLFASMLSQPCFEPTAIALLQKNQLHRLQEKRKKPLWVGFQAFFENLFGKVGYGLSSLGDEASLTSFNQELLLDFHRRFFVANNMCLGVVGNCELGRLQEQLETQLGELPSGNPFSLPSLGFPQPEQQDISLDKQQAAFILGTRTAGIESEDKVNLELLVEYCSDMAGPFFTRIREERGLAYRVSASQLLGRGVGAISFYLATAPKHLGEARALFLDILQEIREEGITKEAFEATKNNLIASYSLADQSHIALSQNIALHPVLGLPAQSCFTHKEALASASYEAFQALSSRILREETFVTTTVKP